MDLTGRIVGGQDAQSPIPWQVIIADYGCGGTILDSKTILTAAHCRIRPGDYSFIEAGITKEGNLGEHGQKASIESVVNHPNFDWGTGDSDLAIIRLSSPLTFNAHVRPACLPPYPDFYPENVEENVKGIVSGWGLLKDKCHLHDGYTFDRYCPCYGPESWDDGCCVNDLKQCKSADIMNAEKLQYVSLTLMTNEKCREFWTPLEEITENMTCAGFEKSGCQGDSGGPLVIPRSSMPIPIAHTAVIYGVVSHGQKCGNSQYPGVYTRVSKFLPWIQSFLE